MKLKTIILFVVTAFILSACSTDISDSIPPNSIPSESVPSYDNGFLETDVEYGSIYADYRIYNKPEALIEAADSVLIGKVVSRSFKILDYATGLPPTETTEEFNKILCTIYTVDVITSYKGDVSTTINIRTQGGIKDECISEQLQALKTKTTSSNVIPIMEGMPQIKVDEIYLFSLRVFEGTDPCIMNPYQSIISIQDPSAKDIYGYISTKDIISYFGEDKWDEFKASSLVETE